jgi:hypothetical protein
MRTRTGFWIEVGFNVEADNISKDELVRQLTEWAEEYHSLDGFRLENGEEPTLESVHFECDDC